MTKQENGERGIIPFGNIIKVMVTALAILVTIGTFGMSVPLSVLQSVAIEGPVAASSDGEVTAICDTQGRRLLILDDDYNLSSLVRFDSIDSPLEAVTDVCVNDGTVYVAGLRYAPDSSYIVQERVVAYRGGVWNPPSVVYEISRNNADTPAIMALSQAGDDVVVALCDEDGSLNATEEQDVQAQAYDGPASTLSFVRLNKTGPEVIARESIEADSVFDVGFDMQTNGFVSLDFFGRINGVDAETRKQLEDYVFTSIDIGRNGNAYAADNVTGSVYQISDEGSIRQVIGGTGFESVHVASDVLMAIDVEGQQVVVTDLEGGSRVELTQLACSQPLVTYTLFVWLCRLYLVVLVLLRIARSLKAAVVSGETSGVSGFFAATAVLAAIALAIVSTSYASYQSSVSVRTREIGMCADLLQSKTDRLAASMSSCDDRKAFRGYEEQGNEAAEALLELIEEPSLLVGAAANNDVGMYFVLYGVDDQGPFLLYDSLSEYVLASQPVAKLEENHIHEAFAAKSSPLELYEGSTLRDRTMFRLVNIVSPQTDETIGVIEVGSKVRSFEASVTSDLAERVIALLVGLFVVYLAYVELRAFGGCVVDYLRLQQERPRDALATLTRPLNFLVIMLASTDGVMSTLIGRTLLANAFLPATGILLALPAVMQGVGLALGHLSYAHLGSRMQGRRLMSLGAVVLIAGAAFAAVVVWQGSFALYCAAKLVIALPLGLFTSMVYSLPRQATDESIRTFAAGGVKRTDTSGAATGTILGGYVAQSLGQAWVYVLIAVTAVCVLALVLSLFPKSEKPLEAKRQHAKEDRETMLQFLSNHHTLALILCIMLPSILAAGYNSFLFPLYSAELGLSTASISNMFVLGQLVVYVAINSLDRLDAAEGKWRVGMGAVALLGVVFLLFSFNHSIIWAVTVIALVGVLCKASDAWKTLWLGRAMRHGLPAGRGVGSMFATRSVLQVVQPLLLGLLLSVSQQVTAIVLGGICIACSWAFYLFTRHSKFA